jgi:eukaryotic-like serine/threonine-protein kinase
MGEVYRARDAELGREVALKILPESFANDAERVARLRREAQILASLNHPHIAAIHGVTDSSSGPALVLELIEGSTVAALIAGQPARKGQQSRGLALERSLDIARQIADALEAAHEKGIVHRDLKPANIKMRPDGTVKVLDFGIAKAIERKDMSPEQARGEEAIRRSDVWAFGVILFEMLSGQRPFNGATKSDVLAAILQTTPDWSALPSDTPPGLRRLVQRCLERDPKARLHDIGDARLEIEDAIEALTASPETTAPPLPAVHRAVSRQGSRRLLFALATAAALAAIAATAYFL